MGIALARHDAILRDVVESHDGHIVKTTGDGVHAVFADANDAIGTAVAAQRALDAETWGDTGAIRVRMGVHTGTAEGRGGDYYGPAVNQAARLMGIAHGGQIVCSGVVAELVDGDAELVDLGPHRLRDVETPLRVFQVVAQGLETQFPPLTSLDVPHSNLPLEIGSFVGRIDDVTVVVKAFADAATWCRSSGWAASARRDWRCGSPRSCCPTTPTACGGASSPPCVIPTASPTRSPPRWATRPPRACRWLTA